jgi:hypothetical protein
MNMGERDYHGWNIDIYDNHAFLIGANFNTNTHTDKRETYVCFYFGKWTVTIGKFYKFPKEYEEWI